MWLLKICIGLPGEVPICISLPGEVSHIFSSSGGRKWETRICTRLPGEVLLRITLPWKWPIWGIFPYPSMRVHTLNRLGNKVYVPFASMGRPRYNIQRFPWETLIHMSRGQHLHGTPAFCAPILYNIITRITISVVGCDCPLPLKGGGAINCLSK